MEKLERDPKQVTAFLSEIVHCNITFDSASFSLKKAKLEFCRPNFWASKELWKIAAVGDGCDAVQIVLEHFECDVPSFRTDIPRCHADRIRVRHLDGYGNVIDDQDVSVVLVKHTHYTNSHTSD